MKVAIDRDTLPADGQEVTFKGTGDEWFLGTYDESEMAFITKDNVPYCAWIVYEWEPL